MAYASVSDVQQRLFYPLTTEQQTVCAALLEDAAAMIDAVAYDAPADAKLVVSCRMVLRAIAASDGAGAIPMGASQGSMSGIGYSQSWTIGSGGSVGELYLGKADRQLLGLGNRIGSYSPVQELSGRCGDDWH